jgi:hypothetical protein
MAKADLKPRITEARSRITAQSIQVIDKVGEL